VAKLFPEDAAIGFVPYQFHDNHVFTLPLTEALDKEAWEAVRQKDWHHESPNHLPVAAWTADVDQPAFEIAELGNRAVSEFQELETAAYRRDSTHMKDVLQRIKLHIRAIEGLMLLQTDALAFANAGS
jgi:hypothetical protein